MSKFYYHGTEKESFLSIIETGEIKCRRLLVESNIKLDRTWRLSLPGCNGLEYISLCNTNEKSLIDKDSAYRTFIVNHYCFIISDEIDAIKTIYRYDNDSMKRYKKEYNKYLKDVDSTEIRFSIMPDEYQVRGKITMNKIVGIGFPFWHYRNNLDELNKIFDLSYKLNLDAVDTANPYFIDEYESIKCKRKTLTYNNYHKKL